jgi:hypothetical protein
MAKSSSALTLPVGMLESNFAIALIAKCQLPRETLEKVSLQTVLDYLEQVTLSNI